MVGVERMPTYTLLIDINILQQPYNHSHRWQSTRSWLIFETKDNFTVSISDPIEQYLTTYATQNTPILTIK